MEPKPPQKSFASRHPILTTILIGVPLVFFISALANSGSSSNNYAAPSTLTTQVAETQTSTQPANMLALKSVRYYRNGLNQPCANGEVANISNQTLGFVQANIEFRDKNGNLISPDETYLSVNNLLPGQTATFDDCSLSGDGAILNQTTVSFIGQFGGASADQDILYEDDTKPSPAAANITNQPTPAAAATPAATPTPAPTTMKDNWSTYASTSFAAILNEPGYYLGDNVRIVGMAFDFLGEGGRGGTENYVEIEDPNNPSSPTARIVLQVDSNTNYNTATQDLNSVTNVRASGNLPDSITAYGTVRTSESFSLTSGGFVSVPVIEVTRIDKCNDLLPTCELGATSVFPIGLTTPSTVATTNTAPTQTQISAQTGATANPRYFQLNLMGVCTNYGNNGTIILTGYPYANGYSIPTDNISAWYDGNVAFTVPSDVTAGTYQVDVRGYQQGMGSCPDVNGGNITVR